MYQRERCVADEMEACWKPINPRAAVLQYNSDDDPFCPLAVARKFNQLQRRQAAIGGTQSLVDLRQPAASRGIARLQQRPRSSGGRFTGTPAPQENLALPCLAGATLQLRDGGGIKAVRQPPLRADKGLPSSAQLKEGLARRGTSSPSKTTTAPNGAGRCSGLEQGRVPALGAGAREEFGRKITRRDDILQDLWLKMHSGEDFTKAHCGEELARLLRLYRSATLEVIEDMMRHPDLEQVADGYTRKKGEGMRSYRAAVAQDADYADATEAAAWLGFAARRNPLFLPPKAAPDASSKPLAEIGINSDNNSNDLLARLRDAQDFILLGSTVAPSGASGIPNNKAKGNPAATELPGGSRQPSGGGGGDGGDGGGGGGGGGGGVRRLTVRDKLRTLSTQLASAQQRIRELEDTLRSLEAVRDKDRGRAARAREAAAEAGRRKLTKRMYQLLGDAAMLEKGLNELDGEITAVRVRLFAERLDVARKRMLKKALTAEMSAKTKARRRRENQRIRSSERSFPPTSSSATIRPEDENPRWTEETSAVVIQARVRGMQARKPGGRRPEAGTTEEFGGDSNQRDRGDVQQELAAAWTGAAARRRQVQTQSKATATPAGVEVKARGNDALASRAVVATRSQHLKENEDLAATTTESPTSVASLASGEVLSQVEDLGVVGVRAFFDSLGLGACSHRLRESSGGIDGSELARIARAPNPDAELLAAGVSARLHRVKLLSALGIGNVEVLPPSLGLDQDPARSRHASVGRISGRSGGGGPVPQPVMAIAALHMLRQLRTEQAVVADALCRSSEASSGRHLEESEQDFPPEGFKLARDADDGVYGIVGARRAAGTGTLSTSEGASLASSILPVLEEVLSAQQQLSSKARALLRQDTKESSSNPARPAPAASNNHAVSSDLQIKEQTAR